MWANRQAGEAGLQRWLGKEAGLMADPVATVTLAGELPGLLESDRLILLHSEHH